MQAVDGEHSLGEAYGDEAFPLRVLNTGTK